MTSATVTNKKNQKNSSFTGRIFRFDFKFKLSSDECLLRLLLQVTEFPLSCSTLQIKKFNLAPVTALRLCGA